MEVVTTSNLVSSEIKKITTTFQTIAMNSLVMLHDLMRGQIGSYIYILYIYIYIYIYICKYEAICSFMTAKL